MQFESFDWLSQYGIARSEIQKKGLGTSVHIVKITSYKKKITQPQEISLKN